MRRERRCGRCSITAILSFFFFSCSSLLLCLAAETTDTITTNTVILDGEIIVSMGKKFAFGFFTLDGAEQNKRYVGIWYYGLPKDSTTVVWIANRNNPITGLKGYIRMGEDGNLQVMDMGTTVWFTNVSKAVEISAKLMDSGNLILTGENKGGVQILWQSFSDENPSIFLPAMGEMDENKVLQSWMDESTPAIQTPSPFSFELVNGVYVIKKRSTTYWRSTSSNDFINSNGIPLSVTISLLSVSDAIKKRCSIDPNCRRLVDNRNNTRLVMHSSGQIRFYDWSELIWSAPSNNCSIYNVCGPYGICNNKDTANLQCNCLNGFKPKSQEDWDSRVYSTGCIKLTTTCKLEREFSLLNVSRVGNPDARIDYAKNMEACRMECLNSCECSAFSFEVIRGKKVGMDNSSCWLWIENELKDLQGAGFQDGRHIYVRFASSEPTCSSIEDCKAWPNSVCEERSSGTTESGKKKCICIANYRWDSSTGNCTRSQGVPKIGQISTTKKPSSSSHLIVVITTAVVLSIAFFGVAICIIIMKWRMVSRRKANRETTQERATSPFYADAQHAIGLNDPNRFKKYETGIEVPFFEFESIVAATEDFSNKNKLGQGGFGPVYKGKLPGGQEVAVKRLSRTSEQGLVEFKNEVLLIAKLQHRNLVRLLGYSIKGNEKILLYEYMPNKSLDSFIFGEQSQRSLLNWERRFEIIMGIARGLLYLHQDSRLRIIHRDLKTSNILLDAEMNPKISDFGLARIFGGNQNADNTNRVVGTYGYMSPEYALNGIFSTKSDVFSFGVMLLEIISGKKSTGSRFEPSFNLLGFAWELWKMDKVLDIIDRSLCGSYNAMEVSNCINVGLLCVQEEANDRPNMSTVVFMLGSSETTPLPIPKEPAFITKKYYPSSSASSSTRPEMYSINEISITEEQAR